MRIKNNKHKQSLQDSFSESDKKALIDFYALLQEWDMEDQNKAVTVNKPSSCHKNILKGVNRE